MCFGDAIYYTGSMWICSVDAVLRLNKLIYDIFHSVSYVEFKELKITKNVSKM